VFLETHHFAHFVCPFAGKMDVLAMVKATPSSSMALMKATLT
jgi:hypothetical protein